MKVRKYEYVEININDVSLSELIYEVDREGKLTNLLTEIAYGYFDREKNEIMKKNIDFLIDQFGNGYPMVFIEIFEYIIKKLKEKK